MERILWKGANMKKIMKVEELSESIRLDMEEKEYESER